MIANKQIIPLKVNGVPLDFILFGENESAQTTFRIPEIEAQEFGEAEYQIIEGNYYEYELTSEKYCLETSEIVTHSRRNKWTGRLSPNIYVGTLAINILGATDNLKCGELRLEVRSKKTSYRRDYRSMLSDITEKCTELLLQPNSPVSQYFEVDFEANAKTVYQRFAFAKSVIETEEFSEALHKILSSPVTKWKEIEHERDIRAVRKINSSAVRQIAQRTNRIALSENHPLRKRNIIHSIPSRVRVNYKKETVDTPENRFIKFALVSFQAFCNDIIEVDKDYERLKFEALSLSDKLDQYLSHSIFREISALSIIPLNSPILQRKEGYREILRVWLMFDLASKLIWHGGEDIYRAGKRDVATLYEYWLFFKLLDVVKEVFMIEPKSIEELISKTNDGLGLQLKQGKFLPVDGVFENQTRRLNIQFSYNRTFSGGSKYPSGGSWTRDLRPDYTLTIWPHGIDQHEAEKEELIVHVHFDAKYRVDSLKDFLNEDSKSDLNSEKEEQNKGVYKRADLLKMHAYRDAIRRTAGAYVLYPGSKSENVIGFHEILPGLGAFAISPSQQSDGILELKIFLSEVVQHFLNRASQRERMSFKTFETHRDSNINEIREPLPEVYGANRSLLPDDTFVLIAYCKNDNHLEWIVRNDLYNARTGSTRGSLRLNPKVSGAAYLLLHGEGELQSGRLFKLKNDGPRIFSKDEMIAKAYPEPSQNFYLVFDIENKIEIEFENVKWDISHLEEYKKGRGSVLPFAVSLSELMKVKIS
ncbi:MAG: DUF2357 domain-containing protein [Chryseolinea sp.]